MLKRWGVTYRTAWNWYHRDYIPGAWMTPSGNIEVPEKVIESMRDADIKKRKNDRKLERGEVERND